MKDVLTLSKTGCSPGICPCRRRLGGSRQRPSHAGPPRAAAAATPERGARSPRTPPRLARSRGSPPAPLQTDHLETHNNVTINDILNGLISVIKS